MRQGPIRIFDSRKAQLLYESYKQYRSSDFVVPPGYIGLVEIIAPEDYLPKMTFTAVRFPTAQHGEGSDCFDECEIGKRYRRWKCTQSLGDHRSPNIRPTKYTEYNEHIVYWGLDPFLDKIVEFEYVVRPGNYYLVADRCENDVLNDCVNPTIIEFSLERRYPSYHDLDLPHECGVWRQNQLQVTDTRPLPVDPIDPEPLAP